MRPTTRPEAVLRAICRRLRAEGARASVVIASAENAVAVGSWPGVADEIGLVLAGAAGVVQVQAGARCLDVAVGAGVEGRVVEAVRGVHCSGER